ncbi:transporter substrate-binding domain-containing protein [Chelatococcus sambhunathii]|uniref:Transporter substrate-binding domain-containing protein n=1 Tax=Chelatococcus sambhunathii TaxID=363953 RepID=A0ABU1DFB6_9HYPH|nr:transporter substrate-binding domain-containing protein [Chelatococcus sambhunathii]MDR4306605.1 transporter substrate-binding domain-containing protein [Chelatococcus sambhunathii]
MTTDTFRVGLMFSSTGPYSSVAEPMLNGAMLAISEINGEGAVRLDPVVVNPGGDLSRYASLSSQLLSSGIRQVVGCYTSSSRKEVIPAFEKHDGMLWYPSHYEGFESSDNVVYTGAAPNQHILPLIDYLMSSYGDRAFCVGSNYIWAWENNRILREVVVARAGTVLAERYLPVGETDFDKTIEAILAAQPNFVFSSLIGVSGYSFIRRLREACVARGIDQPAVMPIASCNLNEPDLVDIGGDAVAGHISSSVYFSSLQTPESRAFVSAYAAAYPDKPWASADAEASYIAVKLLAAAMREARSDEIGAVRSALANQRLAAPQGEVLVDAETMHLYLTPRIGRSRDDATFEVIREEPSAIRPDPYLVRFSATDAWRSAASRLRVVS